MSRFIVCSDTGFRLAEEGGEGMGGGHVGSPGSALLGGENPLLYAADRLPVVQHIGKHVDHQCGSLDGALVPAVATDVVVPVHAEVVVGVCGTFDAVGKADGIGGVAHVQHEEGELSLGVEGGYFIRVRLDDVIVEMVGRLRGAVALVEGLGVEVEAAGVYQREAVILPR